MFWYIDYWTTVRILLFLKVVFPLDCGIQAQCQRVLPPVDAQIIYVSAPLWTCLIAGTLLGEEEVRKYTLLSILCLAVN
jgi:drug/metabolite transporter (DMT)-like permease